MCENKENKNEQKKILVDDLNIIVTGTKEKPYYQIQYHEHGSAPDHYDVGFGSYYLDNVFQRKEECFEISPRFSKKATTNEELLDHLQEIEIAIACQVNAMSTLFCLLNAHADQIDLDAEEQSMITCGLSAITGCINVLAQKSDLERRAERERAERHN